jgi:hypothetical protein
VLDGEAFVATLEVTRLLDDMEVPYVIGGSVASTVHGLIRTTMDVDIVADLKPEHIGRFVATLADHFYVDEAGARQAVSRRTSFNLIHLDTMVKVDVFLSQDRPFDHQQLERRLAHRIHPDSDERLWILTPEDVILAKLEWFRRGGSVSERQWRDILGVVGIQGARLDKEYLQHGAAQLGVEALLDRVLKEGSG